IKFFVFHTQNRCLSAKCISKPRKNSSYLSVTEMSSHLTSSNVLSKKSRPSKRCENKLLSDDEKQKPLSDELEHYQVDLYMYLIERKRLHEPYLETIELDASNLHLTAIERFPFQLLPKLVHLDLSNNQLINIVDISVTAKDSLLERLILRNNQLKSLLFVKEFKHLKHLDISNNCLLDHERFLTLCLCSTLTEIYDSKRNQYINDNEKYQKWMKIMYTDEKIQDLWLKNYADKYQQEEIILTSKGITQKLLDDFQHDIWIKLEKQFPNIKLSPIANYLIHLRVQECVHGSTSNAIDDSVEIIAEVTPQRRTSTRFKTHLTDVFNQVQLKDDLITLEPPVEIDRFEDITFVRCHSSSEGDYSTSVRMCAFEPTVNSSSCILATCGGNKICFIDLERCNVTHIFEDVTLNHSKNRQVPGSRKKKSVPLNLTNNHFTCLCWKVLHGRNLKILLCGATNGNIYLLCPEWNLLFGKIEILGSCVECLLCHPTDESKVFVGLSFSSIQHHSLCLLNIQPYLNRLQDYISRMNKENASDYDVDEIRTSYVESIWREKLLSEYEIDAKPTDLLFLLSNNQLLLATQNGLRSIFHNNNIVMKYQLPEAYSTCGQHIESLRLIKDDSKQCLIVINILDKIYVIDLLKTTHDQTLHVVLTLNSPSRQISSKMGVLVSSQSTTDGTDDHCQLEIIVGQDDGIFYHHFVKLHNNTNAATTTPRRKNKQKQQQPSDIKCIENRWPQTTTANNQQLPLAQILCTSVNQRFLCLTTSNSHLCIYKRKCI
ncbi:unnamed protein product, partial [Didymodactylos carnosus]